MILHTVWLKNAADFKRGRDTLEDGPCHGRPATVTTQEIINKMHDMLLTDWRLTKPYIATELSPGTCSFNYLQLLEMTKVSAQWVPKLLATEQKLL